MLKPGGNVKRFFLQLLTKPLLLYLLSGFYDLFCITHVKVVKKIIKKPHYDDKYKRV
jgi:hypothetical protein